MSQHIISMRGIIVAAAEIHMASLAIVGRCSSKSCWLAKQRYPSKNVLISFRPTCFKDLPDASVDSPARAKQETPVSLTPNILKTKQTHQGIAALVLVAIIWGTYTPAYKYLYTIPSAPSPQLVNALQSCMSALLLTLAACMGRGGSRHEPDSHSTSNIFTSTSATGTDSALQDDPGFTSSGDTSSGKAMPLGEDYHTDALTPLRQSKTDIHTFKHHTDDTTSTLSSRTLLQQLSAAFKGQVASSMSVIFSSIQRLQWLVAGCLTWQPGSLLSAGAELAVYSFAAVTLNSWGLQYTSATKAALLTQTACLFTPLLVLLTGKLEGATTWAACGLGLVGSLLVVLDGSQALHSATALATITGSGVALSPGEMHGQLLVLASALFYSLVTFRLGQGLQAFRPLHLAAASNCCQALLFCTVLVGSFILLPGHSASVADQFRSLITNGSATLALLWLGVGPGALAAFLQTAGQQHVPPAQAQVAYNTTALWSAVFAACALRNEAMGLMGWMGGATLLVAAFGMIWSV